MDSAKSTNYSIGWANTIAHDFLRSCPRGWKITRDITQFTPQKMAFVLAKRPNEWRFLRDFIKTLDRWIDSSEKRGLVESYYTYAELLAKLSLGKCPESMREWLTEVFSAPIMYEQRKQGGGGKSYGRFRLPSPEPCQRELDFG